MVGSESRYQVFLESLEGDRLRRDLTELCAKDARSLEIGGRTYVNLASNDYLALRFDETLIARAVEWARRFGTGSGASRLVTGNLALFARIEQKVAGLKKKPAALLMASGFQANAGVLQALFDRRALGEEPLVFADRLNHASMHFGCRAAGVRQIRYRHLDAAHLGELLAQYERDDRPKFILTESVFSMDGDVAPVAEISSLARAHDAMLIVDDAHATGVLGAGGRGRSDGADIVIGTFSKALGSFGAYVACSDTMRDYLVNRCSGFIYSTALPPQVLGSIDAALDLLPNLGLARACPRGSARRAVPGRSGRTRLRHGCVVHADRTPDRGYGGGRSWLECRTPRGRLLGDSHQTADGAERDRTGAMRVHGRAYRAGRGQPLSGTQVLPRRVCAGRRQGGVRLTCILSWCTAGGSMPRSGRRSSRGSQMLTSR